MAFRCARCHAEIDRSFKACPHCGEPVTDFLRRYADEPVDGKYRIVERLGAGGMGEVYKVEHAFLRTTRVIKVIKPKISEAADAHDRFLREAQLATKVQHPNVATLHDFSALPDGSHYMVSEYIEGKNLAEVIRQRGVLKPDEAIRYALQTLSGLEAIHRAGIIHRDISPENLMITADNRVKIIDLGVAKAEQGGDYAATQTGIFVGKLRYSSPEQLGFVPQGEKIDARADLYSLAIVLYEMLTGRPPFEATSPHQYILHHSGEREVKAVDLTKVPPEIRPVLAKALERDRTKRFATAAEFASALQNVPASEGETTIRVTPAAPTVITKVDKPRRNTGLFIAIALVVIAFGALATWRYRRGAPPPSAAPVIRQQQPPTTTTVNVTPPPAPVPAPVVEPVPQPFPVQPKPQPKPAPPPEPEPEPVIKTFVEGGDSTMNEAAMAFAQDRLRGVRRVSLDATGGPLLDAQIPNLLRRLNLTLVDNADVVIHFRGKVEHLRFGRKRRMGEGSITKNGRTVFRYEMRPEEYRVGDNPAEAFARVLDDIFNR